MKKLKEKWDIQLRKIDYNNFPFESKTVPFIKIAFQNNTIIQANTESEKIEMLTNSRDDDIILAAWPGNWSQDVFIVDNKVMALSILDGSKIFQEILETVKSADVELGSHGGVKYLGVTYIQKDSTHCHTGFSGTKGRQLYDLLLENGVKVETSYA